MADVLAFGAHPDDVEIGCGGTVALLASQGRSVVIVDFTRGEMGTRGTPEERAREAKSAAKRLGAASRVNLELPDGLLPFTYAERPTRDLAVERVVDLIRELRPRLLLANYPSDAHPDHVVVGEVVKQARYPPACRSGDRAARATAPTSSCSTSSTSSTSPRCSST